VRLVIDATVAIEVALSGGRLGPLDGHELAAPALLLSECTSVLRELAYRGELTDLHAREAVGRVSTLPIALTGSADHHGRAYELARSLGWAKTCDAEYLAVAEALGAPLVTLDARLARSAARRVEVLAPTDVPPADK
jgi:predicted nucleic acid-binding protein